MFGRNHFPDRRNHCSDCRAIIDKPKSWYEIRNSVEWNDEIEEWRPTPQTLAKARELRKAREQGRAIMSAAEERKQA